MDAMETSSEAPAGTLPGLLKRAFMVIVAPVELFRTLREEPAAWGAIFLGAALTAAATIAIPAEIFQEFTRAQMLEFGIEVPVGSSGGGRLRQILGSFGAFLFWPVIVAVQAALFSLLFLFLLGYEGRFKQYFTVSAHASLVIAFAGVILLPIRIAARRIDLSPSLESLVPFLEEGLLFRWLSFMDLFQLWVLVLLGMGAAVMDGKGREGASAAVAVGAASLLSLLIASFTG